MSKLLSATPEVYSAEKSPSVPRGIQIPPGLGPWGSIWSAQSQHWFGPFSKHQAGLTRQMCEFKKLSPRWHPGYWSAGKERIADWPQIHLNPKPERCQPCEHVAQQALTCPSLWGTKHTACACAHCLLQGESQQHATSRACLIQQEGKPTLDIFSPPWAPCSLVCAVPALTGWQWNSTCSLDYCLRRRASNKHWVLTLEEAVKDTPSNGSHEVSPGDQTKRVTTLLSEYSSAVCFSGAWSHKQHFGV